MIIVGLLIIIGMIVWVIYEFKGDLDGIIERQSDTPHNIATQKAKTSEIQWLKIQQQPVIHWKDSNEQKRFNITDSVEIIGKQNGFRYNWLEKRQFMVITDTDNGIYLIKNLSKKKPLYYQNGEEYCEVTEELTLQNGYQQYFRIEEMTFSISIPNNNRENTADTKNKWS